MSYYVNMEVVKLDVKIPKDRVIELFALESFPNQVLIGSEELQLLLGSEDEYVATVPVENGVFHLTKDSLQGVGGNKSDDDEFLAKIAEAFRGDFEIRCHGEDGDSWAIRVVAGKRKKVALQVVEVDEE